MPTPSVECGEKQSEDLVDLALQQLLVHKQSAIPISKTS